MADIISLYNEILEATKVDADLCVLCQRAAEYARLHLYVLKISRCNSLGEVENLLEEFRKRIYEIMRYCRKKKYIDDLAIFTVDVSDQELTRLGSDLGEFL